MHIILFAAVEVAVMHSDSMMSSRLNRSLLLRGVNVHWWSSWWTKTSFRPIAMSLPKIVSTSVQRLCELSYQTLHREAQDLMVLVYFLIFPPVLLLIPSSYSRNSLRLGGVSKLQPYQLTYTSVTWGGFPTMWRRHLAINNDSGWCSRRYPATFLQVKKWMIRCSHRALLLLPLLLHGWWCHQQRHVFLWLMLTPPLCAWNQDCSLQWQLPVVT